MVSTSTANNYHLSCEKNEQLQDHLRNLSVLKVDHPAFKRAHKPTRLECKKNPLLCLVIFDALC